MSFLWPQMLWLALLCPAAIVAGRLFARRRSGRASASARDLPRIRAGRMAGGRVRPTPANGARRTAWRFWSAWLLIVVALARPQWGVTTAPSAVVGDGEILIALDLSRSMLTRDVAPSRLEQARALAERIAEQIPEGRIGLIAFAGDAHLLAPPSRDRAVLNAFLPTLRPDHLAQQGTNFAAVLEVAQAAYDRDAGGRALVLLTDGETDVPAWRDRLAGLRQAGVKVVAVSFGSPEGGKPPSPAGGPLRDAAGRDVVSRSDPSVPRALATQTGGRYFVSSDEGVIAAVLEAARGSAATDAGAPVLEDHFAIALILAALLLAWSALAEWPARPRLRRLKRPAVAAAGGLVLLSTIAAQDSHAVRYVPLDVGGGQEADPLKVVREVLADLTAQSELDATDYLKFVEAATRYGEVHRGHGHPISEGVLRDGLDAVVEGRRRDPRLADWAAAEAKLRRLLVPPPPVPEDGSGPADPANEPLDGAREVPAADNAGEEPPPEDPEATPGEQGLRNVGGARRDQYDAAEWREGALVQTLDELQRLREADSAADLFLLKQRAAPTKSRTGGRPW